MSSLEVTSTSPDGTAVRLASATVCVLSGGRSNEREVSLASGARIVDAMRRSPEDGRGPGRVLEVEVLADGRWRLPDGSVQAAPRALLELEDVDLFFLALHGGQGEDGTLQGFLAAAGRAFTGTGVVGSAVGMDKVLSRDLVRAQGVRLAPGVLLERRAWSRDPGRARRELAALSTESAGWAVKPRAGGSSVGASIVRASGDLDRALELAFAEEDEVLVEVAVAGVEVTGAVLDRDGTLEALPVVEIRPAQGEFFDYRQKYAEDGAVELCPAPSLDAALERRVRDLSLLAHRVLRAEGYSRSDFIVPFETGAAGETGPAGALATEPVFLELNTLPGMTPRSLVPLAAAEVGLGYRDLCLAIATDGLRRGERA